MATEARIINSIGEEQTGEGSTHGGHRPNPLTLFSQWQLQSSTSPFTTPSIKMSSLFRHTQVCAHIQYNLDYSNFVQLKHNTCYCCVSGSQTHMLWLTNVSSLLLRCATRCTVTHYTTDLSWDGTSLIL